jgi:hypothetical protein
MDIKTAKKITSIRLQLHIPAEGFQDEKQSLAWYKQHYQQAKGSPFLGDLGYRFDLTRRSLMPDFEYDDVTGHFSISSVPPIDGDVPFDQHILSLAQSMKIDHYNAPALRLIVLMGRVHERMPEIPNWILISLGSFRLLAQSPGAVSEKEKEHLLDASKPMSGNLIIGYWQKRKRKKIGSYLQVFMAYSNWIYEKRQRQNRGEKVSKKGYLVWIAKRLVDNYGWKSQPSSYTVKRYLDRARVLWDMSPFVDSERQEPTE